MMRKRRIGRGRCSKRIDIIARQNASSRRQSLGRNDRIFLDCNRRKRRVFRRNGYMYRAYMGRKTEPSRRSRMVSFETYIGSRFWARSDPGAMVGMVSRRHILCICRVFIGEF